MFSEHTVLPSPKKVLKLAGNGIKAWACASGSSETTSAEDDSNDMNSSSHHGP